MTEFGKITQVWSSIFMVGQPHPHLEGRTQHPQNILGPPAYAQT